MEKQPIQILRDCVALSFVVLDHDEHAANRFYLENLDASVSWARRSAPTRPPL